MCRLRPYNRHLIASSNEEKSLAYCRCPIITSSKLIPLHPIPISFECMNEASKCLPFTFRIGAVIDKRSPCGKLLDIFKNDDAWTHQSRPSHGNPSESSDFFLHRFCSLCFAKMFAIWGEPGQPHWTPGTDLHWINIPDTLAVMLTARMVGAVHCNRRRIVIDCNINTPPCGKLDSC